MSGPARLKVQGEALNHTVSELKSISKVCFNGFEIIFQAKQTCSETDCFK